ncbi:hypothetical protein LINGRAHAP2_LOCUS23396 [Linum grandiflorum]
MKFGKLSRFNLIVNKLKGLGRTYPNADLVRQAHMALTDGESSDAENQEKTWNEWYLDSGCSHHMTGDATQFSEIKYKLGGKVTFGENGKGRIIGKGKIGYKRSNLVGVCWSYRSSISYVQEEINIDAIKSHIAGQICITGMRLQDW